MNGVRRILSKSSLGSTPSSVNSSPSDEISKLQSEIEVLKQTVDSLRISLESKDGAIAAIAREKEKLYIELKVAQRTNRNLLQELSDERDIHSKEKEYLVAQLNSKRGTNKNGNEHGDACRDLDDSMENDFKLTDELKAKDEIIYNIGTKYLKIKSCKTSLQRRLTKLQLQSQKTCENVITLLHENRITLDDLFVKLLTKSNMPSSYKKYLKLLKVNANLHYENTQLKILISLHEDKFHKKMTPELPHRKEIPSNLITHSTYNGFYRPKNYLGRHSYHFDQYERDCKRILGNFDHIHKAMSPCRALKANSDTCLL